jgi:thiol:disulfide interchange protein DsbD
LDDGILACLDAKDGAQRRIRTVGDKWAIFQTENFNASSQPWYVLLTPDEKLLTSPVGYTPDADQYAAWLQCGLDAFDKQAKGE